MEMKTLYVSITEADIIRSIKNLQYSPLEYAVSRALKENVDNVEVKIDCIIVWNNDDTDYCLYGYEEIYLSKIKMFLEEWYDFKNEIISDFSSEPFSFSIIQQK